MRFCEAGGSCATIACIALACGALSAQAQTRPAAQQRRVPEIAYRAPPSCPDRDDFTKRVRARMRSTAADAESPAEVRRIEIRVDVVRDRAVGHIVLLDGSGRRTERRIEAASCAEASDALALIAALAIERRPARDAESAAAAAEPATEPAPKTLAQPRGDAHRAAAPPEDTGRASAPVRRDEGSAHLASGSMRARFGLLATGMVVTGVQPAAHPALALAATFRAQAAGVPELALRAGVRIAPAQREAHAHGVASFSWWTGLGALCLGAGGERGGVSALGCMAFEAGRLSASGSETLGARDAARFWAALGPAAVVAFEIAPPISLEAGVEALFPLVRDRFLLADQTVHRAPLLGFRGALGVGLRLW